MFVFFNDATDPRWQHFQSNILNKTTPVESVRQVKVLVSPDDRTATVRWPLSRLGKKKIKRWSKNWTLTTMPTLETRQTVESEFDLRNQTFLQKQGDWFAALLDTHKNQMFAYAYGNPRVIRQVEVHPTFRNKLWGRTLVASVLCQLGTDGPVELRNAAGETGRRCYQAAARLAGFDMLQTSSNINTHLFTLVPRCSSVCVIK